MQRGSHCVTGSLYASGVLDVGVQRPLPLIVLTRLNSTQPLAHAHPVVRVDVTALQCDGLRLRLADGAQVVVGHGTSA